MGFFRGPNIVTDGLVFAIDAGSTRSYPGTGITASSLVNGSSGTLQNGVAFSSTNGGTWVFDGTDDKISIPHSSTLSMNDNLTVEFWFKYNSTNPGSFTVPLMEKYVNTAAANFKFYFDGSFHPKKMVVYATRGGTWGTVSNLTADLEIGDWNHICWTYSNGGVLHVNGAAVGGKVASGVLTTNASIVSLGNYLDGNIGNFKIYNKALSPEEVEQNYNAQKSRFGL